MRGEREREGREKRGLTTNARVRTDREASITLELVEMQTKASILEVAQK